VFCFFVINSQNSYSFADNRDFNIICNHMRFEYKELKSLMPADSVYIAIVREPLELFISTFVYMYNVVPAFHAFPQHGKDSVELWLDQAEKYVKGKQRGSFSFFAKSGTFYDFGFDNWNESESYISNAISQIHFMFDLVLVSDHMDESLVLLSDLMNWSLNDVACMQINRRIHKSSLSSTDKARVREKVRRWNKADAALFDYFNATLWKKIESYGSRRMAQDVVKLKRINENLLDICIDNKNGVDVSKLKNPKMRNLAYKPSGVSVTGFNIKANANNHTYCEQLIFPENVFMAKIFDLQYPKP